FAVGATLFATVAVAETVAPLTVPSFGVTSTVMVSPALPLPGALKSKESVRLLVLAVVFLGVPFTFHTKVSVTLSPSASALVAVAASVSFVPGEDVLRLTVA